MNTFEFQGALFRARTGAVTLIYACTTTGAFNGDVKNVQTTEDALNARVPVDEAGRPWGNAECIAEIVAWLTAHGEDAPTVTDPTPA